MKIVSTLWDDGGSWLDALKWYCIVTRIEIINGEEDLFYRADDVGFRLTLNL